MWNVRSRKQLGDPLRDNKADVYDVAFSPDGRMLASGGDNEDTILLWDVASHTPLGAPLAGHNDTVRAVAFSPDGKTLASASDDGDVRLWPGVMWQQSDKALHAEVCHIVGVSLSPRSGSSTRPASPTAGPAPNRPMTAAWIGFAGGIAAVVVSALVAVRQSRMDERLARVNHQLDVELARPTALVDRDLRAEEVLTRYRQPLAAAAFDLQSRLYNILRLGFLEDFGGDHPRAEEAMRTTCSGLPSTSAGARSYAAISST